MANPIEAMMRGLSGGKQGGLGRINYMKPVGGISGGGVRANAGAAPQVRAPGASDPLRDERSALAHGDDLLKGYLQKWFPTPEKQAADNDFSQALAALPSAFDDEGRMSNKGLWGAIQQAQGNGMRPEMGLQMVNMYLPYLLQQNKDDRAERQFQQQMTQQNRMYELALQREARAAARAGGKGGGSDDDF